MDRVEIKIPSKPQFLQMLRLTTASLANNIGFDIDDVEDLKVIVSELATYVLPMNDEILMEFELEDDSITINISTEKLLYKDDSSNADLIMKQKILQSLADEIKISDHKVAIIKNK